MSAVDFYCDVVFAGRGDVRVIEQTRYTLAFEHTAPEFTFHVMVAPRLHVPSLAALTGGDRDAQLDLLQVLARVTEAATARCGQAQLVSNSGALQHSPHLHWHVVSGVRLGGD